MKKFLIFRFFIFLGIIALFILLSNQELLKNYALDYLKSHIEKRAYGQIKIGEIAFTYPLTLHLKKIVVNGACIEKASLSFSLRKLLQGEMQINHLVLEDVEIVENDNHGNSSEISEALSFFPSFELDALEIINLKYLVHLFQIKGAAVFLADAKSLHLDVAVSVEPFKGSCSNVACIAKIVLDMDGSQEKQSVQGAVEITKGTFEIPETGSLYQNIEAKLRIENFKLILSELTASDAFAGTIKGFGEAELDLKKQFPFVFNMHVQNTKLVRLDYATATGDGFLTMRGDLKGALLEGKLVAEQAKVKIPQESKVLVQSVDVTYINQNQDVTPPTTYEVKPTIWPIYLDLDFEVKKPFSIKGQNFKSRWKGGLKIKGDFYDPELYGEFKLLDGRYKFRGRIFEIKEGTIAFAGKPGQKTSLYVIGSRELNNIRADVILKGPLNAPAISFRSNPPLPEKEIISWILFGHGAKDLNAFEGSELNQSIKDLKVAGGEADFFTKIRNKIGVDTIDISQNNESENNDVSIKVGKYVSRGVLVSVNKSFSAEANRLEIEAKLFKDFKVQAEIGDDAEGQLNLKWKMDY